MGENLPAIAAICRRLGGIPLAIDFAATRVATLGLQQVAAGLDDRWGMVTGGRRTAPPRHRTLRATLDWSYELLPEPERLVMRRLAVFAGDFTAEAASLVAAGGEIAASEVVHSLANLITKSLVTLEVGSEIALYRLHETTRAYAIEKLAESGEFEQVARRHANYYRDLFDRAEMELETLPAPAWLAGYGRQIGQVRAALDWAFSPTGAAEVGVALTVAAVPLWVRLSLMEECRSRVERALSGPAESRDARRNMQLNTALGAALFVMKGSSPEMLAAFTSAFEIAETLDDADYRLRALWGLFIDRITSSSYRAALAVAEKFCTYAENSTGPADQASRDRSVGVALRSLGDLTLAERYVKANMDLSARHALELWNLAGRCFEGVLLVKRGEIGTGLELLRTAFSRIPQNAFILLFTLVLAEIADALGRDAKAAEGLLAIDEALARSERNEERWCVAELLRIKGELILLEGAPQAAAAAEEHFLRSLDWARRQGALSWELRTATSLARLQHDQGRIAEARSHLQSVYDRFGEGFESADLKTAKAYLDSWVSR